MLVRFQVTTAEDWEVFRSIRLRALADAPDAFGTTLEEAMHVAEAGWRERAAGPSPTIVVFEDDRPVSMGGIFAPPDVTWAMVWGMWTAPEARGRGYGGQVLRRLVEWGLRQGREVGLHVTEGNAGARDLYLRHDFEPTGEWEPLRVGSTLLMERLRLAGGAPD